MISLDRITFAYPRRTPVFEHFSWNVKRGDIWTVLGPSGCGKSTLLLLLAGLIHAQKGHVKVDGQDLERPRPKTSLILQEYGLLPWATIRENVALGPRIRRFYGPDGRHAPHGALLAGPDAETQVQRWLQRLDIASVADQIPGQISGGQRQRTAIARALVLQPDVLLMDEPFSALDAPTRETLQTLTLSLCVEAGLTVILVTHSIEEAAFLGQRILLLSEPPNTRALIIENTHAANEEYRASSAYQVTCSQLRKRLSP